jgi:hypothetical protein
MLNQKFYWGTTRKAIIAFGNMFNNIHIDRRNSAGTVIQTLKVPLSYAPRQKFIARITAQPGDPIQKDQVIIPRMAFEVVGIQYDPNRRVSLVQQNRTVNNTADTLNAQYAPTPYNINMALYSYTKNQDDGLQIVEQILPYFNPDYNLTLNAIPQLGIKNDLPIILDSVSYEDDYEGDFRNRRAIIWTLNFTMKLNFFGPINKQGIIRTTNVTTYSNPELTQQQQAYSVTVSPNTAVPGDTFDFVETFEDFE